MFGRHDDEPAWGLFADEMLRQLVVRRGAVQDDLAKQALALPGFRSDRAESSKAIEKDQRAAAKVLDGEMKSNSPFGSLVKLGQLDDTDAQALAVLCAIEVSAERRRVVIGLGGRTDGTMALGLLNELLPRSAGSVAPEGRLVTTGYVSVGTTGAWSTREVTVAPTIVWLLKGSQDRDPALPFDLEHLVGVDGKPEAGVVLVAGPDRSSRRRRAMQRLGSARAVAVDGRRENTDWQAVVREATLFAAAVLVEVKDNLPAAVKRWIEMSTHISWGILSESQLPIAQLPDRPWLDDQISDRVADPTEVGRLIGGELGAGHRLTHTQIDQIRRALPAMGGDASHAARRLITGELDHLTTRIRPMRSWNDLVLPQEEFDRVRMVAARYRHRDRVMDEWGFRPIPSAGVIAMFSGPPGTGKTMSAEIIANDLGLDLFKVNLATMVSKYIGETEKNLEQLFDVADTGNVVLLFDEADSIFGKRSEVSDAQDRYANLEVSYLLQRIERFDGLVILTTNLSNNIDSAFLRRIHVVVDFPTPDEDERRTLWKKSLVSTAPMDQIDIDWLAKFKLSGADIRAVSLGSAFRAADSKGRIAMDHVVSALYDEMRKQGRLVDRGAFVPYDKLLPAP